jgi:hypothetical protein
MSVQRRALSQARPSSRAGGPVPHEPLSIGPISRSCEVYLVVLSGSRAAA